MLPFLTNSTFKYVVILLGLAYLAVGLLTVDQYGISYDEEAQRYNNGVYNYWYATGIDKSQIVNGNEKYHGPAFELTLVLIEKGLKIEDPRQVYLMRHSVNFLVFFCSVVVMFFLGRNVFGNDKWGLFTALLYALTPRFFAEAHYNSKDIICLSFMVISLYTLIRFAKKPNLKWALLHSLAMGYMIDIRLATIFMIVVTLVFVIYNYWLTDKRTVPLYQLLLILSAYLIFQFGAITAFWPILWEGPFLHLKRAFIEVMHLEDNSFSYYGGLVKYWGQAFEQQELPWHYIPGWMLISIPLPFILLALAAITFGITKLFSFTRETHQRHKFDFLFIACFLGMLVVLIIKKPGVYDGWRHVYFLYGPFVLVAVKGAFIIYRRLKNWLNPKRMKVATVVFLAVIFAEPAINIIRYHPYQFVYFNTFATTVFSPVEESFEMDYWGLGYRQALAYLFENNEGTIKLRPEHAPGYDNQLMFSMEDRKRLEYYDHFYERGIYYLADYRSTTKIEPPISSDLIHQIKAPSGTFLWIYKTTDSLHIAKEILKEKFDFESSEFTEFDGAPSGARVNKVGGNNPYGFSLRKVVDSTYFGGTFAVRVNAKFKAEEETVVYYVLSIDRGDENIYYHGERLDHIFEKDWEWRDWTFGYDDLDKVELQEGDKVLLYLWSPDSVEVLQDDLEVRFLNYKEGELESKR